MSLRLISISLALLLLFTAMPLVVPADDASSKLLPDGAFRVGFSPSKSQKINDWHGDEKLLLSENSSAVLLQAEESNSEPKGDPGSGWTYDILVSDQAWNARNDGFQSMEMDPGNGNELYVIYESWTDYQSPGSFQGYLVLRRSTNGGETWSPEIWTFRYPTQINGQYPDMKEPDIAIGNDGMIWLTYTVFAYGASRNVLDMQIYTQYMNAASWGTGPWTGRMVSAAFGAPYNYHRLPTICVQQSTNKPIITTLTYDYISATQSSLVAWQYLTNPATVPWEGYLVDGPMSANWLQHPCMDSGASFLYITAMSYYSAGGVFDMVVYQSTNNGQDWTMVGDFYDDANVNSFYKPSIASTKTGTDYVVCSGTYLADPANAHLGQIGYAFSLDDGTTWSGYIMAMGNYQRMPYVQEYNKDGFLMSYRQEDGGEQYSTRLLMAYVADLSNWYDCGTASDAGSFQASNWFAHVVMQIRPGGDYAAMCWSDLRDAAEPITENSQTHVVYSTEGGRTLVDTDPSGLQVTIDGISYTAPTEFNWPAGYEHEFWAVDPQIVGPDTYNWDSWSNGMALVDYLWVGPSDQTIIAYYSSGTQISIPLHQGWNLVSVPLVQTDESVFTVLSSIMGSWDRVYYYNSTYPVDWVSNSIPRPDELDTFFFINHKIGFWVNITNPVGATLLVSGSWPAATAINLYTGWNLVGYPSATSTLASATLPAQADWVSVFSATPTYITDYSDKTQVTMSYGNGYWVHVTSDCVWTVVV
jgi:hypothetical protein